MKAIQESSSDVVLRGLGPNKMTRAARVAVCFGARNNFWHKSGASVAKKREGCSMYG